MESEKGVLQLRCWSIKDKMDNLQSHQKLRRGENRLIKTVTNELVNPISLEKGCGS